MENPNEYDDDAFVEASNNLSDAINAMWEAGASIEDIRKEANDHISTLK